MSIQDLRWARELRDHCRDLFASRKRHNGSRQLRYWDSLGEERSTRIPLVIDVSANRQMHLIFFGRLKGEDNQKSNNEKGKIRFDHYYKERYIIWFTFWVI